MGEDTKPPLFADLMPVTFGRDAVSPRPPPTLTAEEAAKQAALEALLHQIRECVCEADAASAELRPLPTDKGSADESLSWLAAQAIYLAWAMSLAWLANSSGDPVLTSGRLDGSMLPHEADDDQIISMAGGMVDGRFTRAVLKRLKAKLPAGKLLPDALATLLEEDGVSIG